MSQEASKSSETQSSLSVDSFIKVKEVLGDIGRLDYFDQFTKVEVTDDVLHNYTETKKEMQDLLKEIIPLGQAFKFATVWFRSKTDSEIDASTGDDEHENREACRIKTVVSEKVAVSVTNTPVVSEDNEVTNTTTLSKLACSTNSLAVRASKSVSPSLVDQDTSQETKCSTVKLDNAMEESGPEIPVGPVPTFTEPKSSFTEVPEPDVFSLEETSDTVLQHSDSGNDADKTTCGKLPKDLESKPVDVKVTTKKTTKKKQLKKNQSLRDGHTEIPVETKTSNLSDSGNTAINSSVELIQSSSPLNSRDENGNLSQGLGMLSTVDDKQPIVSKVNALQLDQTLETSDNLSLAKSGDPVNVKKTFSSPRRFGLASSDFNYVKGNVLNVEENREVEFKSLFGENLTRLPWKIMEKARPFICGVLNAGGKGTIYFGIGDSYDDKQPFKRGEIVGLAVEELKDEISKAFQFTLNDHIKSDDGKMQKGGDMNCVTIHFVPVFESEKPTGRYVVEIEVERDWAHCKVKVYYFQEWKPKRDLPNDDVQKGGLKDLYSVAKEEWKDPVIRTCGETSKVKNIDIEKQIREPLAQKYKEFQDDAKKKHSELPIDEEDVQKYCTRVRESLQDLNVKEISYILIANKLPSEYRGAASLAFLRSIQWMAVFDLFDSHSREDGLFYILNETNDSAPVTVKDLSEFKCILPSDDLPTRGTTWIERNKPMQESDWTRHSKDCLYRALSAYQARSPTGRVHCVFFGFSDESIQEMADIIECSFSIIGSKAGKSISIFSEKKEIIDRIVKCSKPDVRKELKERSISGYPWKLLKMIFQQMVGTCNFNQHDATTDLPFFDGKLKPVLTRRLNTLTDLEVYYPNPKFDIPVEEIEKARENFYKGCDVGQLNLFYDHDIERTLQKKLTARIDNCLKRLSNDSEVLCNVEIVQLRYESGSGATTLCRRILWNKRNSYRCAVVNAISVETDFQIQKLQNLLYDADQPYTPPVLILVDNFSHQDVRQLLDKISERRVKCVILNTVPISIAQEAGEGLIGEGSILELRQLDRTEIQKVKRVLLDVTSKDESRRYAAQKVLEREKRFIWLGLELFGHKYQDIDQRIINHINDIIQSQNLKDESKNSYEMILRFCSLIDFYSRGRCNYPHACVTDILRVNEVQDDMPTRVEWLHDKFGGLLLETFDESKGFRGWRPAHHLVGELVRKQMDLLSTINEFLTKMNEGTAFARTYLNEHAVTVCLDREIKSSDTNSESTLDDETIAVKDTYGALQERTKYSPLIEDVMRLTDHQKRGIDNALDIMITLNQNVRKTQHKARTWQQIARIVAYEIGMNSIPNDDLQIGRINALLRPNHQFRKSSTKGFEIAHLLIDEAIKLQDFYVHHLVTKGEFFMVELRELEKHFTGSREITAIIKEAISTGRKGIAVYEDALKKMSYNSYGYLDAMVGKLHTVVRLLEILKRLPYFTKHHLGPDASFEAFIHDGIWPKELEDTFNEDELTYLLSLKDIAIDLSSDLFEEIHFVKLRRTELPKKYFQRELRDANTRALKLSKKFYQVTRINPAEHITRKGGFEEETVYDILSQHNETPFSSWKQLTDVIVREIYRTLQSAIQKETARNISIMVFAKAALHLPEKPALSELLRHVDRWCKRFPKSVWAHLYNYMVHFPIPNNSLDTNLQIIKNSITVCTENSRSREGLRRSGAEYLLGRGRGLNAIIRPYEVSKNSSDMRGTKFWQSSRVFRKLERVCGRKISNRKGVLNYKDIDIPFDNQRYPRDSNDDLWFCLGFTLNGPYAFDPIDKDSYEELEASFFASKCVEKGTSSSSQLSSSESYSSPSHFSTESRARKALNNDESTAFSSITVPTATIPDNTSHSSREANSVTVKESQLRVSTDLTQATKKKRVQKEIYPELLSNDTEALRKDRQKFSVPSGHQKENPSVRPAICLKHKIYGSQISFPFKDVDKFGRLRYGAVVVGARKSAECLKHLSGSVPPKCNFAHGWAGDTILQFICDKCTKKGKEFCKEKIEHEKFIYDLGPYRNSMQ